MIKNFLRKLKYWWEYGTIKEPPVIFYKVTNLYVALDAKGEWADWEVEYDTDKVLKKEEPEETEQSGSAQG